MKLALLCFPLSRTPLGFPGGSDGKESDCNAGVLGSIPGLGKSPRGGHGNPLQYSCLENPMDRGPWQATVHGVMKSQTQLNTHTHTRAHMYMLHRAEIILAMSFLPSFFTWQYIISSYSLAVIIINSPSYPFII